MIELHPGIPSSLVRRFASGPQAPLRGRRWWHVRRRRCPVHDRPCGAPRQIDPQMTTFLDTVGKRMLPDGSAQIGAAGEACCCSEPTEPIDQRCPCTIDVTVAGLNASCGCFLVSGPPFRSLIVTDTMMGGHTIPITTTTPHCGYVRYSPTDTRDLFDGSGCEIFTGSSGANSSNVHVAYTEQSWVWATSITAGCSTGSGPHPPNPPPTQSPYHLPVTIPEGFSEPDCEIDPVFGPSRSCTHSGSSLTVLAASKACLCPLNARCVANCPATINVAVSGSTSGLLDGIHPAARLSNCRWQLLTPALNVVIQCANIHTVAPFYNGGWLCVASTRASPIKRVEWRAFPSTTMYPTAVPQCPSSAGMIIHATNDGTPSISFS